MRLSKYPVFLLTITFATLLTAQDAPPRITVDEVAMYRGKVVTACGMVEGVVCAKGSATRLLFSTASNARVAIVAPDSLRSASTIAPEQRFEGRSVCATGVVQGNDDRPDLVVNDLSRISVESTSPPLATHAHWPCEDGVTMPTVVRDVKPSYTAEAMRTRTEGLVRMVGIVEADGTVGNVRVVRSLHPELDEQAVKAFKGWQFRPGTFRGEPAAVGVVTEMTFTIRRRNQP